ncbi:DUF7716 domain-containing protein [Burkholderia diffusa]
MNTEILTPPPSIAQLFDAFVYYVENDEFILL